MSTISNLRMHTEARVVENTEGVDTLCLDSISSAGSSHCKRRPKAHIATIAVTTATSIQKCVT